MDSCSGDLDASRRAVRRRIAAPSGAGCVREQAQPAVSHGTPSAVCVDVRRGVYGVDAKDAGADSWAGRYLCWTSTAEAAKARIVGAAFHKKQISQQWSPWPCPSGGRACRIDRRLHRLVPQPQRRRRLDRLGGTPGGLPAPPAGTRACRPDCLVGADGSDERTSATTGTGIPGAKNRPHYSSSRR